MLALTYLAIAPHHVIGMESYGFTHNGKGSHLATRFWEQIAESRVLLASKGIHPPTIIVEPAVMFECVVGLLMVRMTP